MDTNENKPWLVQQYRNLDFDWGWETVRRYTTQERAEHVGAVLHRVWQVMADKKHWKYKNASASFRVVCLTWKS